VAATRLTQHAAAADTATWIVADNARSRHPRPADRSRQGPLWPPGRCADQRGRNAFESLFLGAVRLAELAISNGLLPVRVATDRVRELDALRGDPDGVRARQSARIPLRRYGEPQEFGRAAVGV